MVGCLGSLFKVIGTGQYCELILDKNSIPVCYIKERVGSLSCGNVFESRTETGSELFYLTCRQSTTFILLSILSVIENISLNN